MSLQSAKPWQNKETYIPAPLPNRSKMGHNVLQSSKIRDPLVGTNEVRRNKRPNNTGPSKSPKPQPKPSKQRKKRNNKSTASASTSGKPEIKVSAEDNSSTSTLNSYRIPKKRKIDPSCNDQDALQSPSPQKSSSSKQSPLHTNKRKVSDTPTRRVINSSNAPSKETKYELNSEENRKRKGGRYVEAEGSKKPAGFDYRNSSAISNNSKDNECLTVAKFPSQNTLEDPRSLIPAKETQRPIKKAQRRTTVKTNDHGSISASYEDKHINFGEHGNKFAGEVFEFRGAPAPQEHDLKELTSTFRNVYDSMDVDLDITETSYLETTVKHLIIIPDTNVWVASNDIIDQLLKLDVTTSSAEEKISVTIIIPWMVLQEVDHVIHRNSSNAGFRNAAKYIHNLLASKHPKIRGQKATEAVIGIEFNELMADDSILNCAIQCTKMPRSKTVFVTNDINLLNKALIHDISAFKADTNLIGNIHKLFTENENKILLTLDQSETAPSAIENAFNSFNGSGACLQKSDMDDSMEVDDPMGYSLSSEPATDSVVLSESETVTFESVVSSVQKALTNAIVVRMVEEYGQEDWRVAIKIKPPFTMESALKCLNVHWIAVFSFMFASRAKVALDELLELFKNKSVPQNMADVTAWRFQICQLTLALLSMMDKLESRPRVVESCQLLQKYININGASS